MNIYMAGLDYQKADIEIREKFAFRKSEMNIALKKLKQKEEILGAVLLATCNRTEVWISASSDFSKDVAELFCQLKGATSEKYTDCIVTRKGEEAVKHLFYMAAGLKSQIVGEDQILTQVGDALAFSRENYSSDQVLEVLFRMAVTAGKKCKTEVKIPRANSSAAEAALYKLGKDGFHFAGKNCLVIGNGMMGKLTATLLLEKGADVTVTIRQYKSGIVDTPREAKRIDYEKRYEIIQHCDYIFSATASPNLTIKKECLQETEKKQVFVDLAVPRDIDPAINSLPFGVLYDMDSFEQEEQSLELQNALLHSDQLIKTYIEEYTRWYLTRDVIPQIKRVGDKAASDLLWRLSKPLKEVKQKGISGSNIDLEAAIKASTAKVIDKLLFSIRDTMDADVLTQCLLAMEKVYEEE